MLWAPLAGSEGGPAAGDGGPGPARAPLTGQGYVAVAQMRPNTGPTCYTADLVGSTLRRGERPMLDLAIDSGRIRREGDPEWREDVPVRVEAIPVRRGGPGHRGDLAQHQPARRPHPQPAGADLPAERRGPGRR